MGGLGDVSDEHSLETRMADEQMTVIKSDEVECPWCAEVIKARAVKCRHCGSLVTEPVSHQLSRTDDIGPLAERGRSPLNDEESSDSGGAVFIGLLAAVGLAVAAAAAKEYMRPKPHTGLIVFTWLAYIIGSVLAVSMPAGQPVPNYIGLVGLFCMGSALFLVFQDSSADNAHGWVLGALLGLGVLATM